MFKFKCTITRRGKAPVTRIFKCKDSIEAKNEAASFCRHICISKRGCVIQRRRAGTSQVIFVLYCL